MLENILMEISNYKNELENSVEFKEYYFFKKIISGTKIDLDFNKQNNILTIIFTFILSSKKYKNIDEIIRVYDKYSPLFTKIGVEELVIFYTYLVCKELNCESSDILIENGIDYQELFEVFYDAMKLVPDEVMLLIYLVKFLDYRKDYLNETIYDTMEAHDILLKSEQKATCKRVKKNAAKKFAEEFRIDECQEILNKNKKYFLELEDKIKKINKKIYQCDVIIDILQKHKNQNEILNIDYIMKNSPDELKMTILKYIGQKNLLYYNKLEEQYISKKEHSINLYIALLYEYGIDYNKLSDELKTNVTLFSQSELRLRLEMLKNIMPVILIEAVIYSNDEIINYLNECIISGIVSKEFVSRNFQILLDPIKKSDSKFDLFKRNVEIIGKNLNIKNIDSISYNVFLCDTNIIIYNLEVLEKEEIKVNRSIKNYLFLNDLNLENKIIELKKLDIDINSYLYVLNSDYNIINRIKMCKMINIDIYKDGVIRDEILYENMFIIANEKIEEYLNEKEKYKKMLYKI